MTAHLAVHRPMTRMPGGAKTRLPTDFHPTAGIVNVDVAIGAPLRSMLGHRLVQHVFEHTSTDVGCRIAGPGTVRAVRDGDPLPGVSPAQVVSQLAHRVFGPLHLERVRVVLDYHGAAGHTAGTLIEVAARHDVTTRTVSNDVRVVRSAGETLPLSTDLVTAVTRQSRAGEDHPARVRIARTLGLPEPQRPGKAPVLPRDMVSANVAAAAWSAARVLTAVGPLDLGTLHAAVIRSRRFRHRTPIIATELSIALTAAGATAGPDGRWHAPPDVPVPDRYRVIVERAAGRDLVQFLADLRKRQEPRATRCAHTGILAAHCPRRIGLSTGPPPANHDHGALTASPHCAGSSTRNRRTSR